MFIIRDQFSIPVGVNGYYSAYDYVQKNIHNSIIWVENGLPFYVYDEGFTNSVTRMQLPDYVVILQTDWFGTGDPRLRSITDQYDQSSRYLLIYEDSEGKIFKYLDKLNGLQ